MYKLLACVLVLASCGSIRAQEQDPKAELVGVWKSNAEKTLASMRSVDGVTDKARRLFENDFFGHLIAEYREQDERAYFDRDENNAEGMKEFHPYELIEANERVFVIKYHDRWEDEDVEETLYREGDCYYMYVSKWMFREYFCKIDE